MAIYYATTKPISRSQGRSATASAAYRAGVSLVDERTGLKHDFSKRSGVLLNYVFDRDLAEFDRSELWNKAELAENRKDARTAREWIIALPHELIPEDAAEYKELSTNAAAKIAVVFAWHLAKRYDVAVDVAIHSPDKDGDNRNWHAHIMTTTRKLTLNNGSVELGDKSVLELSNTKRKALGLEPTSHDIKDIRNYWQDLVNRELKKQNIDARIDARSLKEQGIERKPTIKMGWQASAMERRGITTAKGDLNRQIKADNKQLQDLALEINLLNTEKQKEKRHEQEQSKPTAATTGNAKLYDRLDQSSSRGRDQNEPRRGIQKPSSVKSHELGQGHSSQNRAAPTTDQSTDLRSSGLSIEQKRQILKRFNQKIDEIALQLHQHDLKELRDRAKPLLKEINNFRDDKPLNPFKTKAWQQELDKKLNHYSKIKTEHDTKKASGVTKDQKSSAYDIYYHNRPEAYQEIRDMSLEIQEFDRQQVVEQQQQPVRISSKTRKNDKDMER